MELNPNERIDSILAADPGPFRIKASNERGQKALDHLQEIVAQSEATTEFSLGKEYWVRYYLEEYSEAYDFTIAGDLDKEVSGRRGDYRVIFEGQEMVLEVEKDLNQFFKHGHETKGKVGWDTPGSIDLVFAASDVDGRKEELDIPVIVASEFDTSDFDQPTFDQWYNRVREIKSVKEAVVWILLSAIYGEYTKGTPVEAEVQSHAGEIDNMTREYFYTIRKNLLRAASSGVIEVLFNREVSIQKDDEFVDLKSKAMDIIQNRYTDDSEWVCPSCSESLVRVGTHKWVYEPDSDTMTEGQWAEQQAAQEGGFFEEYVHGETLTAVYCFDCLIGGAASPRDNVPVLFDNWSEVEYK